MIVAGVVFLDHTADVGMDVNARSFDELLHRLALGMLALLRGEDDDEEGRDAAGQQAVGPGGWTPVGQDREAAAPDTDNLTDAAVRLRANTPAALVADWLREILFLHEVSRLDYVSATLDLAAPDRIEGSVHVRPGGRAVREIKGVTYHQLEVEPWPAGGWRARVIFDV